MADVLIKTTIVPSSCNDYKNQHEDDSFVLKRRGCSVKMLSTGLSPPEGFRSQKIVSFSTDFYGQRVLVQENQPKRSNFVRFSIDAQLRFKNAQKWWEKGLQPNMKEVASAQDLVDSLMNAGDKLVVVDFFSPGCGGCKALHPKISQFAEMNPDMQFLQVNYEEHKSMCYSLNVHVLPFFRFYRGAQGRVCSFSCTNATIKKFRDALAKHAPDRCSLGPTKGLEEKELIALAANRDLNFTYTPKPPQPTESPAQEEVVPALTPSHSNQALFTTSLKKLAQVSKEETLIASRR